MVLDTGQMGIYDEKFLVLGLDPGRDKTGFAFVDHDGDLLLSGIFETQRRDEFFNALLNCRDNISDFAIEGEITSLPENVIAHVKFIATGNGTGSKEFHEYLRNKLLSCEIIITDERNTTLEARKLYWGIHRPKFFMRLLPESMRVPARILDDLAAWSIATRALKKYRDINHNKL